ncbi:Unknown protein sequence, partial [Pseudomonas amygdali pv. lachrymans]
AGGRRQADQGLDACAQYFLNQFQAAAAGHDGDAACQGDVLTDQCADQLVQRVVAANVFTSQQQLAVTVHEHRSMHSATMAAKRLELTDALTQAFQPLNRRQGCAGQHVQFWQSLLYRFNATEPATAGACQLPTLLLEFPEGTAGDFDFGLHRRAATADFEVVDFVVRGNDAAAQAETDDKVFQIGGADQHDCLADAVVGNRQCHFFGKFVTCRVRALEVRVAVRLACFGGWRSKGRRADLARNGHGLKYRQNDICKTRPVLVNRLIANADVPIDDVDQRSSAAFLLPVQSRLQPVPSAVHCGA